MSECTSRQVPETRTVKPDATLPKTFPLDECVAEALLTLCVFKPSACLGESEEDCSGASVNRTKASVVNVQRH